jgi:VCBS repeat-containing protein
LTINEDQPVEVDLWSLVSDIETSDAELTFSVGGGSNGTAVLLADGHTARFTPGDDFNDNRGSASFVYSVTDTGDGSAVPITVNDVLITVEVVPLNDPPTAVANAFTVPFDRPTSGLTVVANDLDPDLVEGDVLTIVGVDATTAAGALVTIGSGNTLTYDPNGRFDHLTTGQSATDSFSYTIRDQGGAESTATVTMTVVTNQPPVAQDDGASTDEDTVLSIDVLVDNGSGPDTDPDGDDGLLEVSQVDAASAHGASVEIQSDGTLRYDPTGSAQLQALGLGEPIDDTFQYTVRDVDGATDVATVTVRVLGRNDQPVARGDQAATDEDTPLSIDVVVDNGSGADTDADAADVLTVTSFDATSTLGAAVTQLEGGALRYDPTSALDSLGNGESVEDTFTYTISDGKGGTSSATVRVTVGGRNDNPMAVDDAASTNEDTAINIDVLDNDSDPDTDDEPTVATFPATSNMGAAISINGDGTLRYNPTGVAALNSLASGQFVVDSFVYSIADGDSGVDNATVTVTVQGSNDLPVAQDDGGESGADQVLDLDVLDNDSDPDTSDTITITNVPGTSARGAVLSVNANGTLRYDPRGAAALGALGEGEEMVDTFTYTISDGQSGSTSTATVTLLITGVNDPPLAADDLSFSVAEGSEENQLDVLANDSFAPDVGETLTIVAVSAGSAGGTVEIGLLGESILYTPNPAFSGTETFTYTIEDNGGASDTATVSVNVMAAVDQVRFRLETTNLGGNPISSVPVGSEFQLRGYVQDIRAVPSGVFAAFLDVVYETGRLTATEGLDFGPQYQTTPSGNPNVDGLIDEVGAAAGLTLLGGSEYLLFTLQFRADAAGTVTFTGEPADVSPASDVLLFDDNNALSTSVIDYGSIAIQVTGGAPGDSPAVGQAIDDIAAEVSQAWGE